MLVRIPFVASLAAEEDIRGVDPFVEVPDGQARRPGGAQTEAREKDRDDETPLHCGRARRRRSAGSVRKIGGHVRWGRRFTWNVSLCTLLSRPLPIGRCRV